MRDPRKLQVAIRASALAVATYRFTAAFPGCERFGLAAQMRRAAVSVASNIAEGCGRGGERDFLRFLYMAHGSASELSTQLAIALAMGFGSTGGAALADDIDHVQRMLNRLTSSVRRKLSPAEEPARPVK
jgi:four helix bundle protein